MLALLVFAAGVPLAWMGATPVTHACDDVLVDELGESDSRTSLWPPGVRCVARSSGGMEFEETYVTWYELTIAVLCGVGIWLISAALLRVIAPRQLLLGAFCAAAVFLAATVVFFL